MLTRRTVFLSLQAASGVVDLLVGMFAFRLPQAKDFHPWALHVYAGLLVSLAVFLVATIALDWSSIPATQQIDKVQSLTGPGEVFAG